jgi:hypothetical protein
MVSDCKANVIMAYSFALLCTNNRWKKEVILGKIIYVYEPTTWPWNMLLSQFV